MILGEMNFVLAGRSDEHRSPGRYVVGDARSVWGHSRVFYMYGVGGATQGHSMAARLLIARRVIRHRPVKVSLTLSQNVKANKVRSTGRGTNACLIMGT